MTKTDKRAGLGPFLEQFARFENEVTGNGSSWVAPMRRSAIAEFQRLGLPGPRDEQWRQTSVAELARTSFTAPTDFSLTPGEAERLNHYSCECEDCPRLVFVNGRFSPKHSRTGLLPPGTKLSSLAEALVNDAETVREHLGRLISDRDDPFIHLNTAFLQDGAYLNIPAGVELPEAVMLVYVSTGGPEAFIAHPRNLFIAGKGSRATIIESYVGLEQGVYFTNAVSEILVEEDAVLDHYKLQQESEKAFHIAALQVVQQTRSNFFNHAITFGASLSRNDIHAILDGTEIECMLNGLYVGHKRQHMDTHTKVEHAKPNCHSREVYKGVLDGHASGVFSGWILVRQDAQKTDAVQSNRALLLSTDAVINTQPQLEIYADDVKCTHGATVGQISEDMKFYLRSRGIPAGEAEGILTYAFANEIIDEVKVEPVRAQLEKLLFARFRTETKLGWVDDSQQ